MTLHEMFQREHLSRHAKRDMTPLANGATAEQVADLLADQAGNRERGKTRDSLKAKWITSDKFVPMTLPTDLLQPVDIPGKRDKPSRTVGPIVLEANFRGREQEHDGTYNGKVPPVFIIDGQHRHAEALAAGQPTMRCLVGVKAVSKIHAEMIRREHDRRKGRTGDVDKLCRLLNVQRYDRDPTLTIDRSTFHYTEPASEECRTEGRVCDHCAHYAAGKCGLFTAMKIPDSVEPDAYCIAFVLKE